MFDRSIDRGKKFKEVSTQNVHPSLNEQIKSDKDDRDSTIFSLRICITFLLHNLYFNKIRSSRKFSFHNFFPFEYVPEIGK